jgi:hypothetical protein
MGPLDCKAQIRIGDVPSGHKVEFAVVSEQIGDEREEHLSEWRVDIDHKVTLKVVADVSSQMLFLRPTVF